jgi:hypothetical protein
MRKEGHNVKVLHVQAKQIKKSDTRCVRPLLLLGSLLWHDVTTLGVGVEMVWLES